jgi:hypothetical protein
MVNVNLVTVSLGSQLCCPPLDDAYGYLGCIRIKRPVENLLNNLHLPLIHQIRLRLARACVLGDKIWVLSQPPFDSSALRHSVIPTDSAQTFALSHPLANGVGKFFGEKGWSPYRAFGLVCHE